MLFYQKHLVKFTSAFLICLTLLPSLTNADGPKDNIPDQVRRIPGLGVEVPAAQRQQLEQGLAKLKTSLDQLKKNKDARIKALIPDVEIYHRAVRCALEYQEFFHEREIGTGHKLLKQGQERADQLLKGEAPWTRQTGLVVRGYTSKIDQTVQPYGLVIPDNYTFSGKSDYRCDLWFHGRGERLSEVNFINQQQRSRGQYTPADTIVLHPYGRYSNAFKFAGEIDVLEALEATKQNYRIDDRVSVRGFSMGGAACWQFAVHYADRWFAANPGAGFSETPLFLKVFQEEKLKPTWYEKKLWQMYDCPGYALNLFQCPTVAYSGEIDKQKQAADVMELALEKVGIDMVHIIGPDTAHKIHPDSKIIIEEKMDSLARVGRERVPATIHLVAYTLKYNRMAWVTLDAMQEEWKQAHIDARLLSGNRVEVKTENVTAFSLKMASGESPLDMTQPVTVQVDGIKLEAPRPMSDRSWEVSFHKSGDGWQVTVRETGSQDDDTGTRQITASLVVLGAGTLGSTEILQRSAAAGLALSPALGTRFSGNGDVLAFGYNANLDGSFDDKIPRPALRGVGAGTNAPDRPQFQPGPTIAGIIDMRDPRAPVTDGLVIEEGVLPGGFAMAFTAMFFVNEATSGDAFRFGDTALRLKDAAAIGAAITDNPAALGQFAYDGPVGRSQTYLVMSHDSSDGTLAFANDTTVVRWPGVGREASIARDNALLAQASDAIWAEFAPNPLWQDAMGRKLVSVHPIGGCVMADSVDRGVVNAWCQVFDPAGGVHPGLYVCDGSVIPGALGVNPLLTISAISEMAVEKLATDRGWQIDYTSTRPLPADALVAVTPVGKPAEEPTKAELLQQVIDQMAKAKGLIDAGDLDGARAMFHQTYTQITAGAQSHLIPSWTMLRLVLTDGFTTAIGQVIAEFMPILQKVEDRLKAQDYSGALAVIKAEAGDFSPGLGFDEKMSGHIAPAGPHYSHPISDPYRIAAREGETAGEARAITAHFTVAADSIQALMDDPDHQATLTGTLDCAALGGRLTLDKGASFDLLRQNAASVECWNMVYRGTVQGGGLFSHKTFYFKGFKTLQRRPGSTYWADLTTLRVDIWDGPDTTGLPLFQGVMTLGLEDLTHQLSTLKAPMAQGIWQGGADILKRLTEAQWAGNLAQSMQDKALRAEIIREALLLAARSGHEGLLRLVTLQAAESVAGFFGRLIFRVYGGVTAYLYDFPARDDATAPHRKLRLPAPERHTPLLAGGQKLALTRYQGGTLGPVILAPGFGVTADSYTLDTTDENLTEFLVARGYDVWLFDYRGSPALDASREAFDIDDLAWHAQARTGPPPSTWCAASRGPPMSR